MGAKTWIDVKKGDRVLLDWHKNILDAIIAEFSPTSSFIRLGFTDGSDRWFSVSDKNIVLLEIFP